MRIVVNHLTRMQPGYICVAGVDPKTGQHLRPVLRGDNLLPRYLSRHGGPFDIAHLVHIGLTRPTPDRPHLEDQVFDPWFARLIATEDAEAFWRRLIALSQPKLTAIFGVEIKHVGNLRYGTEKGKGAASLGCLRPHGPPDLYIKQEGGEAQIRIRFSDGQAKVDARVTDIRLYGADHFTPDLDKAREVGERIHASQEVILALGLTRAYASSPDRPPLHWLQVNNIHLKEDPVWQLG